MNCAHVRFYAQLNDFLPAGRRQVAIEHRFRDMPSIKDMIEALGVPHTEVALILVNGAAVDFNYQVQSGDWISVYPAFRQFDISGLSVQPPAPQAFIADVHLGRLVAYLRMLGFDTLYPEDHRDECLAEISNREQRVLLTRDIGLLKRSIVIHGYFVRETNPWRQLEEVLKRFKLIHSVMQFNRCTHCNHLLSIVDKADIEQQIPQNTTDYYSEFRRCQQCGKIYWRGSHYQQMDDFLAQIRTGNR